MKKLLLRAIFVGLVIAGVRRLVSEEQRGSLFRQLEAAIERCPPVVAMRQLREQNTLLRRSAPSTPAAERI